MCNKVTRINFQGQNYLNSVFFEDLSVILVKQVRKVPKVEQFWGQTFIPQKQEQKQGYGAMTEAGELKKLLKTDSF